MNILFLGGTAFMGAFAVTQLLQRGHEVTVFHRGKTEAGLPPEVRHLHGDRNENLDDFAAGFRRLAPDVVVDMMLMGEEDARRVVELFRGTAGRLVAISSMDVYRAYGVFHGSEPGEPDPSPISETSPLREQLFPYQDEERLPESWRKRYDKIVVERVVMGEQALPATVLRLPMVYGPRDRQHRLHGYLKRMDDGRPAILLSEGFARWQASRGYVEDMAAAITLVATHPRAAGRIYHVAEQQAYSEAEWIERIGRAVGWTGRVVAMPPDRLPEHLRNQLNTDQPMVPDSSRIRAELGYQETVPSDEALTRTIAWERAHPPEKADPDAFNYAAEDAALAAG
jgi:nucleoside-diphosphate-sugar epimerase